jgi:hypothetical protein
MSKEVLGKFKKKENAIVGARVGNLLQSTDVVPLVEK